MVCATQHSHEPKVNGDDQVKKRFSGGLVINIENVHKWILLTSADWEANYTNRDCITMDRLFNVLVAVGVHCM